MKNKKVVLNAFLSAAAQKSRGQEKSIRTASKSTLSGNWRIPTGSIDLDYGLGGGLKVGGSTLFWGKKSGGKTSSALRVCGNAQRLCRNCFRKAHLDEWTVETGINASAKEGTGESTGEVLTRSGLHEEMTKKGYKFAAEESTSSVVLYKNKELRSVATRIDGDVTSVKPEKDEGGNAGRWSASGFCDCFARKLYEPDEPSLDDLFDDGFIDKKKKPSKNTRAHAEGADKWRESMTVNSYEENVVAWFDEEMTLDVAWARKLGVDTDRMILVWSNSAEEAIDIMAGLIYTGEVDLLVIDSIAQLTPKKELTESAESWQQGLAARLMNKAIRRWNKESSNIVRYSNRPITQIWINQEREKIGVMYGSPATMPGGKGQGFQVVSEVKFSHGKTEKMEEQWGSKSETVTIPIWEEFNFKITKSKAGGTRDVDGTYRQAMRGTDAYDAGDVMDWDKVFKMAMKYLVVQKKSGSVSKYILGDREYTSQSAILSDLKDDINLYADVRESILRDAFMRIKI